MNPSVSPDENVMNLDGNIDTARKAGGLFDMDIEDSDKNLEEEQDEFVGFGDVDVDNPDGAQRDRGSACEKWQV